MKKKAVSGIMLTLLLIGMLTLAFSIQPVKTDQKAQLQLETDKYIYILGENVTITLKNIGSKTVQIGGYPAWQIYTYPEEEMGYPMIFAWLAWSLEPGENDTFTWNQYNEFTQSPAETGMYVIRDTQGWGLSAYFEITDLELEMTVSNTTITIGEQINITLTLRNVGTTNITIKFATSQAFDVYYCRESGCFRWSDGKYFFMMYWEITLDPGETYSRTLQWNLYQYNRTSGEFIPPEPGTYFLWGVCVGQPGAGTSSPVAVMLLEPVEQWIPYVPNPSQWWVREWSLVLWIENHKAYIDVNLVWPDTGHIVSDWGTVVKDGDEIWVDSEMWEWTGASLLVIVYESHTYDLGYLDEGNYTFAFKVWGYPILSISFTLLPPIVTTLDVDPDALKVKSMGQWITAYIELPESYDVGDIDVSKILLDGTISIDLEAPREVGDYDTDGIPDLMVKFDRSEVTRYITDVLGIEYGNVTLTITGEAGGTPFEGSDTIKVLFPGDVDDDGDVDPDDLYLFARAYGTRLGDAAYNWAADFNEDGSIDPDDVYIIAGNYGKTAV